MTDEAAVAVGALAVTCVTHPAVAPGARGWQGLLAHSAPCSARLRILCAPTCAWSILPLLAPGPCPKRRLQDQHCPHGKLVVALVSPICCSAAHGKAWKGSRIKDGFGLIFGCSNKHRHHHSAASSPTTLCLVCPWAFRIGSDITQLNRVLEVQAA